jgi:hypothetical protein
VTLAPAVSAVAGWASALGALRILQDESVRLAPASERSIQKETMIDDSISERGGHVIGKTVDLPYVKKLAGKALTARHFM